jgi:hypothetical protein
MSEILTFIADDDQPFTCPYDGARTMPVSDNGVVYTERCIECNKLFNFDISEDQ